jgi:hypothetical protein
MKTRTETLGQMSLFDVDDEGYVYRIAYEPPADPCGCGDPRRPITHE